MIASLQLLVAGNAVGNTISAIPTPSRAQIPGMMAGTQRSPGLRPLWG